MPPIKLALILVVSIALQLVLRDVWRPLIYIDFPLIVVVYIALQREAWQALVVATLAGLIVDAQSGGLIGAGGFSKTLTAYVIYFAATKVNLETRYFASQYLQRRQCSIQRFTSFGTGCSSTRRRRPGCRRSLTS